MEGVIYLPFDIKNLIKGYLKKENITLTEVVSLINDRRSEDNRTTLQNISNKLSRGTIKFSEVLEIADVLGYDLEFKKRESAETHINENLSENEQKFDVESEIDKFTSTIIKKISDVEIDIKSPNLKSEFDELLSVKDILSTQLIYLKYYNLFCTLLLMLPDGNEFIPVITLIRNIYLHGGLEFISPEAKKRLLETINFLNSKSIGFTQSFIS